MHAGRPTSAMPKPNFSVHQPSDVPSGGFLVVASFVSMVGMSCGWFRGDEWRAMWVVARCHVMWCYVMWCDVVSCHVSHVMSRDVMWYNGMERDVMWCDGMWLWDVLNWEMMCCELQRAHVTVLRLRTTKYVSALQKVLLRYYSVLVLLWYYYEEKNTLQKSRVSCVTTTERERRSSILFCIPHVGLRNGLEVSCVAAIKH